MVTVEQERHGWRKRLKDVTAECGKVGAPPSNAEIVMVDAFGEVQKICIGRTSGNEHAQPEWK